ncbi:hypothetical protein KY290_036003 [Solanum tuberosum]|uniref:Ubiquitin-protein ligase n=1 Tax=Solanum tuberosum TaxID=4113 RepID=A0ABQ7TTE3_SOLTU|nr:hypothetical protein KY290_036003 [Solanum tuberosum]
MADWAGLNNDLLVEIAKRVKVIEDFIVFGCVCNSWRKASTKDNFDVLSPQLPLLMLPQKDDYRELYSLSKGKVSRRLYLPEAKGRECFPSHQMGWFFTQSLDVGEEVRLLNPFSATKIQLPTLIEDLEYPYIINAILSANPSFISDYVLIISYHTYVEQFAFWRPGDINWTQINLRRTYGGVYNMIYYKGQFYFVTWTAELGIIDVQGPEPRVDSLKINLNDDKKLFCQNSTHFYLVEVNDALLLVVRFGRSRSNAYGARDTFKYEVYEIDVVKGVKPNHIYFTDDWCDDGEDIGCYNLENGNIESFYPGLSLNYIFSPTWVIPSL